MNIKNINKDELWVLTRVVDESDPMWDCHGTILGTAKQIRNIFDLSQGIPFGWRLLKGKAARRWIRYSIREERRYQRDKAVRDKADRN
jgi:hypothetical protein